MKQTFLPRIQSSIFGAVMLASMFVAVSGCSDNAKNPVAGTVEFVDGSPLETGRVAFELMGGNTGFTAEVASNGEFKVDLKYSNTPPGEYAVTVVAVSEADIKLDPQTGAHLQAIPGVSLVDAKFANKSTSPLKATIETGVNNLTFQVEPPPADVSSEEK